MKKNKLQDQDEFVEYRGSKYSIKKILDDDKKWEIYTKMSDNLKAHVKRVLTVQIIQMEVGFKQLDRKLNKINKQGVKSK